MTPEPAELQLSLECAKTLATRLGLSAPESARFMQSSQARRRAWCHRRRGDGDSDERRGGFPPAGPLPVRALRAAPKRQGGRTLGWSWTAERGKARVVRRVR